MLQINKMVDNWIAQAHPVAAERFLDEVKRLQDELSGDPEALAGSLAATAMNHAIIFAASMMRDVGYAMYADIYRQLGVEMPMDEPESGTVTRIG